MTLQLFHSTGFKLAAALVAGFISLNTTTATEPNQTEESFSAEVTKTFTYKYLKYLPEGYDGKKKFPLLLFLHGAGERGDNLDLVTVHGPPKLIKKGKKFPFVVISPQCPRDSWWDAHALVGLLDSVIAMHAIDKSRIYCTGLSMGGFGTWELGSFYPERFAALAPICGIGRWPDSRGYTPFLMSKKPVWVFHGAKDSVVSLEESQRMVDALKRRGGKPKFTIYPEAGHDSWTKSYDNPKLYEWFLSHKNE
jgi:predicted peptidase